MSKTTFDSILGQIPPEVGDIVVGTDCTANGIWRLSRRIDRDFSSAFDCVRIDKNERRGLSFVGTWKIFFMKESYSNWKIIKRKNHTVCADCNLLDG